MAFTSNPFPLQVSVNAVFSKYTITPQKGLNFGPVMYNTTSQAHTFEIANVGEFPFAFALFDTAKTPPADAAAAADASKDAKKKPPLKGTKEAPKSSGSVAVGAFTISPECGVVEPGSRQTVSVTFQATGSQLCTQSVGVDVKDRPFTDHPAGVPLELIGESCIPGIECEKV